MFETLRPKSKEKGYSLIELLVVMSVMVVSAQAITLFTQSVTRNTLGFRRQTYATQKALQMLEELREVGLNSQANIQVLGAYDDNLSATTSALVYKYCLTTKDDITHPAGANPADYTLGTNPISGNPVGTNGYLFCRHVSVRTVSDDANMRQIYVAVYLAQNNPGPTSASTPVPQTTQPLASVFGSVRTSGTSTNPSESMDMYFVALESIPGWWSRTSNLIGLMGGAVTSLEARNPGLVINTHWIRQMSFGRDTEYTPQSNQNETADNAAALPETYVYPGYIDYDAPSSVDDYYYLPSWFHGRLNVDGTNYPNDGYAIADQFNHAMRYPDEVNMYNIYKSMYANQGKPAPEPSLRMLLEKMEEASLTSTPMVNTSYANAIILNLHGEMVPAVPLRNYADGAKDPLYYSGISWATNRMYRVVTHPEQLHYNSSTDTIALDTYAYDISPTVDDKTTTPIDVATVFIPGASLSNLQSVSRLQGSSTICYHWYTYVGTTPTGNQLSWVSPTAGLNGYSDAVTPSAGLATWEADNYTAPGPSARTGLRIQFFGVSPTCRAYYGSVY